jgi:hypothetical protein
MRLLNHGLRWKNFHNFVIGCLREWIGLLSGFFSSVEVKVQKLLHRDIFVEDHFFVSLAEIILWQTSIYFTYFD